jgi:Transglycosylase SLT domain
MHKRLQLVLMATAIATFLSFPTPYVQAQARYGNRTDVISSTTDDSGHTVYVNDYVPAPRSERHSVSTRPSSHLVFWSVTEHRWKPVPTANIRAARSAAAEVSHFLGSASNAEPSPAYLADRRSTFSPEEIDAAIARAAARHNVDPNLVRAVIKVESNFNPNAVSRKGAMGLMQLMPQTARQLNVTNPFDPEQNVDAGVRHLKQLMESYGGNLKLSLAAYNAGPGAVARSAGVPHIAETRNYVNRITRMYFGGPDFEPGQLDLPSRAPIHVQRDAQGVLYFSNTD